VWCHWCGARRKGGRSSGAAGAELRSTPTEDREACAGVRCPGCPAASCGVGELPVPAATATEYAFLCGGVTHSRVATGLVGSDQGLDAIFFSKNGQLSIFMYI